MRFYDTKLRCEVFEENENTLTNKDERVSFFFEELPQGKELKFKEDGIPYLEDIKVIPQAKLELLNKISEAKQYLDDTEHKFNMDYEPKVDEDLEAIRAKRSEARAFVRANEETK